MIALPHTVPLVLLLAGAASAQASPTKPTLTLLQGSCKGVVAPAELASTGSFTLRTTVAGKKGYAYSCDAFYDPQAETTDKECTEWLPQQVIAGGEDLDIKLEALDSQGRLALCLKWQLRFNSGDAEDTWYPMNASLEMVDTMRESFHLQMLMMNSTGVDMRGDNPGVGMEANNPAMRKTAVNAYLDSMTHVSHRCVPKAENDMLYWNVYSGAFPPQATTPQLLRISHKLLAISSMIHSIDRKCTEAWNIRPFDSCVPSLPGFPHCHTTCTMTWRLGPGGVASWGMFMLNHHIPSPSFALVQQGRIPESTHGDFGCGDAVLQGEGHYIV